jgi:hypothetical protein
MRRNSSFDSEALRVSSDRLLIMGSPPGWHGGYALQHARQ